MPKKIYIIIFIIAMLSFNNAEAQKIDTNKVKQRYSLALSLGWSHYINSIVTVDSKDVHKDFFGGSARFLWEPGYRISLGFEFDFFRIYYVKQALAPKIVARSAMYAVPFFLVARIRLAKNFYFSAAPGITMLYSRITGVGNKVKSIQWSFSNFQFCASYLYPLNYHFQVGGEGKFYSIGKVNDLAYSLQVTGVYKF